MEAVGKEDRDLLLGMAAKAGVALALFEAMPLADSLGEASGRQGGQLPVVWQKLHLHQLLPHDVRRVLYLDSDVLVRRPLWGVWEEAASRGQQQEQAVLSAVLDFGYPRARHLVKHDRLQSEWQQCGDGGDYFNAGVMVLDLDAFRARFVATMKTAMSRQFLAGQRAHPSDAST